MGKSKELASYAGGVIQDDVKLGGSTDISMDDNASGQIKIDGNNYDGAIALNSTGMDIYHNSGSRSLSLGTNETARLTIDASGRVTMPYQPAMFITGNQNTYQPADSATRVRFNYVKAGNSDGFNTTTHTFTAPVAGKYFMSVYALIQTGTNWEFQFYKNGAIYGRCYTQGDRTTSGHVIMDMAVNDYASIVCATSIYLHQTDSYSGWTIVKVA